MHNFATRERCLAAVIITALLLFAPDLHAQGWERDVTKTGTFSEDLFVGARKITVRATVNGDIMVMGGDVDVDATVVGDVLVMGGKLSVGNSIKGDVLAAGGEVRAEGVIDGDATVLGGHVAIDYDSTGNILVVGVDVRARGDIGGNLKMMGGELTSRANVAGNLQAGGGKVVLRSGSQVVGNASLVGGHRVQVDGRVGGNLKAVGRRIEISGNVDGDADLQALEISILPSARINGNLIYRSPTEAEISPDAQISGDVTFIQSERPEAMMGQVFSVAGTIWLSAVAGLVLLGIVVLVISPTLPFEAAAQIRRRPWVSLGLGFAVLVGSPIAMAIMAVTGIGLPLAVVMAGLYVVVLALGLLDFAILVGWTCARRTGKGESTSLLWRIIVLAVGLVVLSMIALVPGFGALILLIAFAMGTGAVLLQGMAMRGALQTP